METKTTLVLSIPYDTHALHLVTRMKERKKHVVRVDTGDFPASISLKAQYTNQWEGFFLAENQKIDLTTLQSIWYRRPTHYRLDEEAEIPETVKEFMLGEASHGFGGVLRSLPCVWVSRPEAIRNTNYKPIQFAHATAVGLSTPRTLITNDVQAAREFYEACHGNMIYKTLSHGFIPMGGDEYDTIYTSKVMPENLDQLERVKSTAHLFQQYVDKAFELRITVIGERVFPVAIYSQEHEETQVDWRASYAHLSYRSYTLPTVIETACSSLVKNLGLLFGCIDMIVTPTGEYVLIEVNPAGQYLWLEHAIPALGITDALIDLLTEATR